MLSAFHAPSPHGLLVVAPARVTRQIQGALNGHLPGGFDLRAYHSAASARAAITRHQVAGALIAGAGDSGCSSPSRAAPPQPRP